MKVSCPAGKPWVSRDQNSQKRITTWLHYVICKQKKVQILGIKKNASVLEQRWAARAAGTTAGIPS